MVIGPKVLFTKVVTRGAVGTDLAHVDVLARVVRVVTLIAGWTVRANVAELFEVLW